jgi:hypothetical protein
MFSTTGVAGSTATIVDALSEAAGALTRLPVPDFGAAAMSEAEQLFRVSDLLRLAAELRVGVVDAQGAATPAGHASTLAWLRTGGHMSSHTAATARRNGRGFRRLRATVAAVIDGSISHAMATAIVAATEVISDDTDAGIAEAILLDLAKNPRSTVETVRRAGSYLRQTVEPDRHGKDDDKAYRKRFMTGHRDDDGGISGSYYLPPEAAARLQALFDKYARKQGRDDHRTQSVRNVDVLIQLLVQAVSAELLVIVNEETLTDQPDSSDTDHSDRGRYRREPPAATEPSDSPPADPEPAHGDGDAGGTGVSGAGADDPDASEAESSRPEASGAEASGTEASGTEASGTEASAPDGRDARPSGHSATPGHRGTVHPDACLACGRRTSRDVPGLLLPTGHPLPAPHVRRLAGTSKLMRIVLDAKSRILDLGASVRLVPGWMRKAILATYDTCAYDACPIPAKWCEMDHIKPWATSRTTRLDDVAPACDHHNRDRAKNPWKYKAERHTDGRWHITTLTQRLCG